MTITRYHHTYFVVFTNKDIIVKCSEEKCTEDYTEETRRPLIKRINYYSSKDLTSHFFETISRKKP